MSLVLGVFKKNPAATLPTFATRGAACFDVRACLLGVDSVGGYDSQNSRIFKCVEGDRVFIAPGERLMIPTGLIFDIPDGHSVRFHPRSGIALKQGLALINMEGVVDYDYVDPSMILLWNTTDVTQEIKHGERIAQAELVQDLKYDILESMFAPIQKTDRQGGMGSTGKE